MKLAFTAGTAALLFVGILDGRAATTVIPASNSGFVTIAGGSSKGDDTIAPGAKYNYSVGRELHYSTGALGTPPGTTPLAPMERRNFFVFDLTAITDPITSATVTIYAGPAVPPAFPGGAHGYESLDPTELFGFKETPAQIGALADIAALTASTVAADFDTPADPLVGVAAALYTKLGAGPLIYGSAVVSPADDGTFLSIAVTPDGLGFLNAHLGGTVVLGGLLATATPPASPQEIFGFTGPTGPADPMMPALTVTTVPEPATLGLLSLAALALPRRRAGRP